MAGARRRARRGAAPPTPRPRAAVVVDPTPRRRRAGAQATRGEVLPHPARAARDVGRRSVPPSVARQPRVVVATRYLTRRTNAARIGKPCPVEPSGGRRRGNARVRPDEV